MTQHQTSASGKIILFGEHAVVYEYPAIAVPISSLRAYAIIEKSEGGFSIVAENLKNRDITISVDTLDDDNPLAKITNLILKFLDDDKPNVKITIKSDIPIASGLGSGAAVSAALGKAIAKALNKPLSDNDLNKFVFEVEKIYHGTPSGIDNTVIVYEQPIYFVKNKSIEFLNIKTPFNIIVADTGQTALTHEAVGDVRKLYNANPDKITGIFDKIGIVAQHAIHAMDTGNIELLGKLMTENHNYLQQLTVSSPQLDQLVVAAMQAGALGAKLSGGGRGGNMIALAEPSKIPSITLALKQAGAVRVFDSLVQ